MTVRIKTIVLSLREKATRDDRMGLVKTRRLAAMQKQQRAKAGMKPRAKKEGALQPYLYKSAGRPVADVKRKLKGYVYERDDGII